MNNLLSYCGLIDAKIRASDKDLPVQQTNAANNYEEKQQNGSENMPPPATRGQETKQSKVLEPEKMETVSKGTAASKLETASK